MSTSLKILGLIAASIGAILGISSAVVLWTLQAWLAPLAPTVYLASALLGVFVVMAIAWFVVTRRELSSGIGAEGASVEERALQRLVILTANVLLGVLALAIVASWNVDSVRARFVGSQVTHVRLEAVLKDPSPLVRLVACEEIFQRGWVFRSQKALIAALDGEPAVAAKCLQTAKEKDWKGIATIANNLNDGWTAELMRSGDAIAPQVCELAPWSPVMSELSEQAAEPRLLHCATGAASDVVRECCANTLASRGKLLDLFGDPEKFPPEAAKMVFADLVKYGFQPLSLSPAQQKVASVLGTDDEAVRRWVVEVGCQMLDPTEPQPEIIGGLMPLVEADTCNLSAAEEAEYNSPLAWARLCEEVLGDESGQPVQQIVCHGVQDARVLAASETAMMRVHEALRAPFLQRDAEFVDEGLAAAALIGGNSDEERRQAERGSRSAVDVLGLTSYSDPTCKRLVVGARTEGLAKLGDIQEITSFDCPRYRNDLTVAEWLRDNQVATSDDAIKTLSNPFDSPAARGAKREGARALAKRKYYRMRAAATK